MAQQLKSQRGHNVVRMRGAHLHGMADTYMHGGGRRGMGDAYDDYRTAYLTGQAPNTYMDPSQRAIFMQLYGSGVIDMYGRLVRGAGGGQDVASEPVEILPDGSLNLVPSPSGGGAPAGGGGVMAQLSQLAATVKNSLFGSGAPGAAPTLLGMPMNVALVAGAIVAVAVFKTPRRRR